MFLLIAGQPYNVYDFSGSVASIYYSSNDYITNPILPLKTGVTAMQAQLQGTTGVNAGKPVLDVNAFDATVGKEFRVSERVRLRFNFDAFNIFNHPSFDTPNNNVSYYNYGPLILATPRGSLGEIQHTIGSPRFLQADLHLTF